MTTSSLDIDLTYLQAELAYIDILIQYEVRRWQTAGQDPLDSFRGLYVSDAEIDNLLVRPFAATWGQMVSLDSLETEAFAAARDQAIQQAQTLAETAEKQGHMLRLKHLTTAFGLSRFELNTLLICLAPALDLRYERFYGYLQDNVTHKRPTVNLILNLLAEPGPTRLLRLAHFTDDSPLLKYHLLRREQEAGSDTSPLLSHTLHIDEAIVAWLLGRYQPHSDLISHAALLQPQENETDKLLAAQVEAELKHVTDPNRLPLVIFYGPDRATQTAAARLLAAQANRSLLMVDLAAIIKTDTSPLRALSLALRDAHLTGALSCLLGWDACLVAEGGPSPDLLATLCAYPDLVIMVGEKLWQAKGIHRERSLFWFEFPVPTYSQRLALWTHFVARATAGDETTEAQLPTPVATLTVSPTVPALV